MILTVTNRSVRNFYVNIHMSLKNISLARELNWAAEKTRKSNIWYHHKISQEIFKGPNIYLSSCAVSLFFSFTLVFFFNLHFEAQGEWKIPLYFLLCLLPAFVVFWPFSFFLKKKAESLYKEWRISWIKSIKKVPFFSSADFLVSRVKECNIQLLKLL